MTIFVVAIACLAAGFLGGLITARKDAAKLAAIEQEVMNVEGHASAEVRSFITTIRKHL